MSRTDTSELDLLDLHTETSTLAEDAVAGLTALPKKLPCKYFYDKRGSELFDRICELDEYYLTRTELAIMNAHVADMARAVGPRALVVEFGSGSSLKTRLLLEHLESPAGYVPVEISGEHLMEACRALRSEFPELPIHPVCADFNDHVRLPDDMDAHRRKVMYFPGSTIGNFTRDEARAVLEEMAALVGSGGGLLIGIDLIKDRAILEAAYNDAEGVTAAFNLNLLERLNREAGANFDTERFAHRAIFNEDRARIEMHLVSLADQTVTLDGTLITFVDGESIHTENSHKWTVDGFASVARSASFVLEHCWMDESGYFAVLFFSR
jgi:dimethylhistidine N-methyltransferase